MKQAYEHVNLLAAADSTFARAGVYTMSVARWELCLIAGNAWMSEHILDVPEAPDITTSLSFQVPTSGKPL